jgi:hypothetical protein
VFIVIGIGVVGEFCMFIDWIKEKRKWLKLMEKNLEI